LTVTNAAGSDTRNLTYVNVTEDLQKQSVNVLSFMATAPTAFQAPEDTASGCPLDSIGWGWGPPFHLATGGRITGTVVDAFNWKEPDPQVRPIHDARVRVRDLNTMMTYEGTTDADGAFCVPVPGGAAYACTFSHAGYKDATATTPELEPGRTYAFEPNSAGYAALETKTVVLVHGVFGDAGSWNVNNFNFRGRLAAAGDFNVKAPVSLVPGGIIGWLGNAGSVNRQAERLGEYLQELDTEGIRSVHVVAHSMGGLVTRQYIRTHPGKVATLVMLGTPNHGSELATAIDLFVLWAETYLSSQVGLPFLHYLPPAGLDLAPMSPLLCGLNYGGGSCGGNGGCRHHSDETTLDARTQYHTYAGTAFRWASSDPCRGSHPFRWSIGAILSGLTSWPPWQVCTNDFVVPVNSVPLHVNGVMTNVHNWTDLSQGCSSIHKEAGCLPLTEDDCVVGFVSSVLAGRGSPAGSESPEFAKRDDPPAGQNVGFGLRAMAPGDTAELDIACGTADSLVFRASYLRGTAGLRLVDPDGRSVTPDTALVDPLVDYTAAEGLQWYTIHDAVPGTWQVIADAGASPDSVTVLLTGAEYGDVAMVIDLDQSELVPGATQRVEATLLHGDGVLTGASVSGTVTDPDSVVHAIVLVDDGTQGDSAAGDGVYTALFSGNSLSGQYDVALSATGTYGQGSVLNRYGGRLYIAASRPDVELPADEVDLSPAVVDTQLAVTVGLTLRNVGQAVADTVRVQFLEQETGQVFAETLLVALGVGQDRHVSANWIARPGFPEYHLGGRVIVLGTIEEANILNNEAYGAFDITAVPDDPPGPDQPPVGDGRGEIRPRLEVFPNPFSMETTLKFTLAARVQVELGIFDVAGRQVRILRSGELDAGTHTATWDGRNASGTRVASGVYFARMRAGAGERTERLIVVRP
jgi:pimeloyl-ACP methyl ester carboxylesterase